LRRSKERENMHLKVVSSKGEEARKKVLAEGAYDSGREIQRQGSFLFIPINKKVTFPGAKIVELAGVAVKKEPRSLKEALAGKLSSEELEKLPKAYDLIGDIAIIEIPDELSSKKKEIGAALLKTFKNIKVVANKKTSVGTEYRTRDVEVIAGENRTETVHREAGCVYKLDVTTAYFSPRLGTERMRVASQVKADERVLVMFAGIGPYAILIAKSARPSEVYAVELNPCAVDYMKENIRLNKVAVKAILGDAGVEVGKHGLFDRIIMPLPKDAGNFLDKALPALNKGGVVNYYTFKGTTEEAAREVKDICSRLGYTIEIIESVECGTYSPQLSRMCVDFKVLK
jgi:tRNA (guanine37-N1)-methyltransferase